MKSPQLLETTVGLDSVPATIAYGYTLPEEAQNQRKIPVVYVHGWGCDRADFDAAADNRSLATHRRLAFDMPGHGDSAPLSGVDLTVDHVVEILHDLTTANHLGFFALVGHSAGGLVAIRYAQRYPDRVAGLVNVEGNMVPQDCYMTADVAAGRQTKESLSARFGASTNAGFRRYSEKLANDVDEASYIALAGSAVEHCTRRDAFDAFVNMHLPRIYVYGQDSAAGIPYLDQIRDNRVPVHEVPGSSHFPGVDNPTGYYAVIGDFMEQLDSGRYL